MRKRLRDPKTWISISEPPSTAENIIASNPTSRLKTYITMSCFFNNIRAFVIILDTMSSFQD